MGGSVAGSCVSGNLTSSGSVDFGNGNSSDSWTHCVVQFELFPNDSAATAANGSVVGCCVSGNGSVDSGGRSNSKNLII